MRLNRTIATLGLIGLLGCGVDNKIEQQEPVTAEQTAEEPVVVSVEAPSLEPVLVVSNFQPDCSVPVEVQRLNLFNDLSLYLYGTAQERETQRREKEQMFAKTVPGLAFDIEVFSTTEKESRMNLYRRAKNLAGCMNPQVNFDQEAVKAAYSSAAISVKIGYNDSAKEKVDFANEIAAQAGIDVKPYVTPVVEAAYNSAAISVKIGYNNSAKVNIDFAKELATQAQLPEQLKKIEALEATLQ